MRAGQPLGHCARTPHTRLQLQGEVILDSGTNVWGRLFLQKLIVSQLVKDFPGTRRFIIMVTGALH
jgi:hypothetical protein